MKTRFVAFVAGVVAVAAVWAYSAPAQEPAPAPDYETSLHVLACNEAIALAVREGVPFGWCRKESETVNGYQAVVVERVKIPGYGKFKVIVTFQKSQWWAGGVSVESE